MNDRTKTILAVLALLIVVLVIAIWYTVSHQSRMGTLIQIATSSPATTTDQTAAAGPIHITQNGTYYDTDATYPSSTVLKSSVSAAADAKAVALMEQFDQDTITQFIKDGNFDNLTHDDIQMQGLDQRKYTLGITYTTYQSPRTISYVYVIYSDTLGAHPNAYYKTFTFDKNTGAELALSDLFTANSGYLQKLSSIAAAKLPGMIAQMEQVSVSEVDTDQLTPGIAPTADNFQSFYLDGNNLDIVFPPYQVGPYALGTVTLPIARADLSAILKSEYK